LVHEFVNGTYRETNLTNESAKYLSKREELRLAEIELMEHQERVAALRRALPIGAAVKDYEFREGPKDLSVGDEPIYSAKLSDLFTGPGRPLVIYHMMYGKKQTTPCPMCTLWVDGFNGVAHHITQNIDFAVVMAADLRAQRDYARSRGWNKVRLLSASTNTFKYDLGSEDVDGAQDSTISVFEKDSEGIVRHVYTAHPRMAPNIKERGIDLLAPVWSVLDLTPAGRGEWYPSLKYGTETRPDALAEDVPQALGGGNSSLKGEGLIAQS
jgi:predicted dithiol-disulfide oxidoreductase (DUF899 family)